MRVLIINSVCGIGSTGKICWELSQLVRRNGSEAIIAYGRDGNVPEYASSYTRRIGTDMDVRIHGVLTRILDAHGFGSRRATEEFVLWMREFNPDIIHLHNIHGYYLHIGVLFEALRDMDKPIIWTLHDCWAFTGHCAHYTAAACEKWRGGCRTCSQKKTYPGSLLLDGSQRNYKEKKRLFTMPKNMTLVTPSEWLAGEVRASFLGKYPVKTIYNGIDGGVFHHVASDLPGRYGLDNKKIALGVANVWNQHKGLHYMLRLPELLGENWAVVLVGLSERQIASLPEGVIGISRTQNVHELAAWYAAADVYVNTSAGETMGMTTAEAIACGTPVASFDTTAMAEIVGENGITVPYGNIGALAEAVKEICGKGKTRFQVDCDRFDAEKQYGKYWELYKQLEEN